MSISSSDTSRDNLTLSETALAACRPIVGEGGHVLRALCPFHGSDRQRSLRVQVHSGRFVCFACGAGATWTRRVRSGARSSSARRPSGGLQPAGSTCQAVDSRHLHFPGRQRPPPGSALRIHPHRVHLSQSGQTWPSSSLRSRLPCRGAAAPRTCSSGAFP
jgi:CHC2 zinc finger